MAFEEHIKELKQSGTKEVILKNQDKSFKALEVEFKSLEKENKELKSFLDYEISERNKDSTGLIKDFEEKLKEKNKEYVKKHLQLTTKYESEISQLKTNEEEHLRVISVCQNLCKDLEKQVENLENGVNEFPFKFLSDFEDWIISHKKNSAYSWFFTKGKLRKKELKTLWVLLTDFWDRFNT